MRVVRLDDYDVILDIDFLRKVKVAVVPLLHRLQILDERHPGFVPCITFQEGTSRAHGQKRKQSTDLVISAAALASGLRHGEMTYVAFSMDESHFVQAQVPEELQALLSSYQDLLPAELPREMPPCRDVDHRIELVPGSVPPFRQPYRMSPSKLLELRKQLNDLLVAGFIIPSTSPFWAPILFQGRRIALSVFVSIT